jgi:hypothetical protein
MRIGSKDFCVQEGSGIDLKNGRRRSIPSAIPLAPDSSVDAGRGDIRRGSRSSGRRIPAPVVKQSDPSHGAGRARLVLDRHALGERSRQITKAQAENRCLVSKSGPDLQRRDRRGPLRNLAPSDFFHVPAKPGPCRNSAPYLAAHGKCPRPRRVNRPNTSSGAVPHLASIRKLKPATVKFRLA